MKTIISSSLLFIFMTACDVDVNPTYKLTPPMSSKEIGEKVITALQHMSSQEYVALFPTLSEFHQMMENTSYYYGASLSSAKQEFAAVYEGHLITAVKNSFDRIIREGSEQGIRWENIRFERIESLDLMNEQLDQTQVTIVFTASGKTQRLSLEKVLIMNAEWKVSQFIKLL